MDRDFTLSNHHPSVMIDGQRFYFGRNDEGECLVESLTLTRDYWVFREKEDLQAFLVNLPESADRYRMLKLYPDWHNVTPEQRNMYMEESRTLLRAMMEDKLRAGTASEFPIYPDDGSPSFWGKEPFKVESRENPVQRVERQLRELKRYEGFPRGYNDAGKLSVLEHFDWSGINAQAKEEILAREVDFKQLTEPLMKFVYADLAYDRGGGFVDDAVGRKLFQRSAFDRKLAEAAKATVDPTPTRDTTPER